VNLAAPPRRYRGPSVVALGGGHGLAASLGALRHVTDDLSAVVTVADDGGSSGRLRQEFGVLPPGDLRMALSALCDDSDWGRLWRDVLQHRFHSSGPLDEHALGNLLIVTLWQVLGDPVAGLDWVGRLLGAKGRVLPMAAVPLDIEADIVLDGGLDGGSVAKTVRGQATVATEPGRIRSVRLVPDRPPARPEVLDAVQAADWVVFGPGSWFTSVLPHLLVPDLSKALHATGGRRCITLNVGPKVGETAGYSSLGLLQVFDAHAPDLRIDDILADPRSVEDLAALQGYAEDRDSRLHLCHVAAADGSARHDPLRLAAAYRDIFEVAP
jgi:uncharacterized cofD-like protein